MRGNEDRKASSWNSWNRVGIGCIVFSCLLYPFTMQTNNTLFFNAVVDNLADYCIAIFSTTKSGSVFVSLAFYSTYLDGEYFFRFKFQEASSFHLSGGRLDLLNISLTPAELRLIKKQIHFEVLPQVNTFLHRLPTPIPHPQLYIK